MLGVLFVVALFHFVLEAFGALRLSALVLGLSLLRFVSLLFSTIPGLALALALGFSILLCLFATGLLIRSGHTKLRLLVSQRRRRRDAETGVELSLGDGLIGVFFRLVGLLFSLWLSVYLIMASMDLRCLELSDNTLAAANTRVTSGTMTILRHGHLLVQQFNLVLVNFMIIMTGFAGVSVNLGLLVAVVPLMILLLVKGVLVNFMIAMTSLAGVSVNLGLLVAVVPLMILLLVKGVLVNFMIAMTGLAGVSVNLRLLVSIVKLMVLLLIKIVLVNFVVLVARLLSVSVHFRLLVSIIPLMIFLLIKVVLVDLVIGVTTFFSEGINFWLFVTIVPLMVLLLIKVVLMDLVIVVAGLLGTSINLRLFVAVVPLMVLLFIKIVVEPIVMTVGGV